MARISAVTAKTEVRELRGILRAWEAHKNTENDAVEIFREQEFAFMGQTMDELIYGVQPERILKLTIGAHAVNALLSRNGSQDLEPHTLEPGTTLDLERTEVFSDGDSKELYVGGLTLVSLVTVAQTLLDDGSLIVSPAKAATRTTRS